MDLMATIRMTNLDHCGHGLLRQATVAKITMTHRSSRGESDSRGRLPVGDKDGIPPPSGISACLPAACAVVAALCLVCICAVILLQRAFAPITTVISVARSPNGQLLATVYQIEGDATVGFYCRVTLRKNHSFLRRLGECTILQFRGTAAVRARWSDNTHLVVAVRGDRQIGTMRARWGDVTIRYVLGGPVSSK